MTSSQDIFSLRRSARRVAADLGLERQDQVRLATALSELGRDRLGCGALTVSFRLDAAEQPALVVTLEWDRGTPPPAETLELAARLVQVEYDPDDDHSRIVVRQSLPPGGPALPELRRRLAETLGHDAPTTEADHLRAQTRDLITALEETRAQREELRRLNEELEETNQGVLALYSELTKELETTNSGVLALHSELDEKSRQLREAGEAKTRFWTNISHELRTPINAIVALSRLLLDPESPALTADQRQQVAFIASSGGTLLALVGDLLDVAKAEAGQLEVQAAPVDLRLLVAELTGTLLSGYGAEDVRFTTPEPACLPTIVTDEHLLTRVLRNLLSNALKFTDRGEVRLDVRVDGDPGAAAVRFTVSDTGIGIPEDELGRVFEEFYQVRGPHQNGRAGTGLGLPYARMLTELLGGTLTLTSTHGAGTRVTVRIPELDRARPAPQQVKEDGSDQ
ncbi:ATP-binding protein [Streptomyces sp. NPDC008150]|uniref:sensor histidine kinase n=1 Tax=Streptomyces sp. NPDC008150 TaxID=3364816 RepID=UPI0036EAD417